MASTKLKFIVRRLCNDMAGVEYLMLKDKNEEPVPDFVPNDKRRLGQPPQNLAG
jgi:hypothetical protein